MAHHVIVLFARDRQYRYAFSPSHLAAQRFAQEARCWLDKEYADPRARAASRMAKR